MRVRSNAFGPSFLEFKSSRMVTQTALYLANGTRDRSQTWSKVSCEVALQVYGEITIFAKMTIILWRVFAD